MNRLLLVKKLVDQLNEADISYCCWKGSCDIEDILSGGDDLDILVSRKDSSKAQQILLGCGFKLAISGREKVFEGLMDYFGCDDIEGKMVHVQLYHHVICGQRLTENYLLPLEKVFLDKARSLQGIKIPAPQAELTVFVIRKIIQHGARFLMRPNGLSKVQKNVKEEISFLTNEVDDSDLTEFLGDNLPMVNIDDMFLMIALLKGEEKNKYLWLKVRRRLVVSLRNCQRRSYWGEKLEWIFRRMILVWANIKFGTAPKRRLASGGKAIAILGSDGAGKSTAVTYIQSWLRKDFEVSVYHLGRPRPSVMTRVFSWPVRLLSKVSDGQMRMPKPGQKAEIYWPKVLQWLPLSLALLTARDRYSDYLRIRRDVSKGGVVIVDRYPTDDIGWMDSPIIPRLLHTNLDSSLMARLEKQYYDKILPPDQTVLLIVDPEIAAHRQIGDGYDYVLNRAKKVHAVLSELSSKMDVVDTSCSLSDVERRLVKIIWPAL